MDAVPHFHLDPAVAAGLVTGILTGLFTVLGVVLTQRAASRQQDRARQSTEQEEIKKVTSELVDAAINLQKDTMAHVARWGTWRAKLTMGLVAGSEFLTSEKLLEGFRRGARVAAEWDERREDAAGRLLSVPYERFSAALSRAMLVSDRDVAAAVGRLGEAAFAAAKANAAQDPLWPRRSTKLAQERAGQELSDAVNHLVSTVRRKLHPAPPRRRAGRWLRKVLTRRHGDDE